MNITFHMEKNQATEHHDVQAFVFSWNRFHPKLQYLLHEMLLDMFRLETIAHMFLSNPVR